jgi:hypothetical protein
LPPLIEAHYDEKIAAQFQAAMDRSASDRHSPAHFGCFLGLTVHPHRAPQFKVYLELGSGYQAEAAYGGDVSSHVAGAVPHLRSIATAGDELAERLYFLCRRGLRVLDLEPLCASLGMAHRFPALLMTVLELTDGEFYLSPQSALLGIRRAGSDVELKVELVSGLAMNPHGLPDRVERLLQPRAVSSFRRWMEIVRPNMPGQVDVSIVSVRVSTTIGVQLSVYAAEPQGQL